jgi:branched-chain amino acid transport system ATP-binding protein
VTGTLAVSGLTVRYGSVLAVSEVDLAVEAGEIVGLIGPNGAGKTSFIDGVSGFARAQGSILLDGRELAPLAPHARARSGLGRTWQLGEIFDDLTVRENLSVVARSVTVGGTIRDLFSRTAKPIPHVESLLASLELAEIADRSAAELSEGQRKIVGVGRALASNPSVVLLDEPAAGLDSTESARLGDTLRAIAGRGTGMLLVDHDMGLVMNACDRIVVLDFGCVVARGTPEQIRADRRVIDSYLGVADQAQDGPN